MDWIKRFDERARAEIRFATLYTREFGGETYSHQLYIIIGHMAEMLTDQEKEIARLKALAENIPS